MYVDVLEGVFSPKPFNVNLQYQTGQPIPRGNGESYDHGYGISTWLETETEFGKATRRSVPPPPRTP